MAVSQLFIYFLFFSAGFVLVSLWSFWLSVRPPQITLGFTPDEFGLSAEDVVLTADDGAKLAAWFIGEGAGESKRAIILLHGYPAEKSDMLSVARALHPEFAVLLMDLRSFGESEGAYTTLGLKESRDVAKALDFLTERGYGHIGIFGFSLGGSTALLAAAEDSRPLAVASYGAFADLRMLGHETYRSLLVLKYPLVALMELWARLLFGEWADPAAPVGAAERLTIPVLIIHNREDEQISFTHAERLREALSNNEAAEFYDVKEGRHGVLPADFEQRVKAFFVKSL
ncbi:alpha/beta fold hydrolase [Candidatus Kaiserbacteria bacterium]|nr:alpha/beta fold hydrolase [Candidatus Kaiserbacteria bacterium]